MVEETELMEIKEIPGNQMRWSIQNINKFHGGKGEDPDHHISEFEDVLKASGKFSHLTMEIGKITELRFSRCFKPP